MADDDEMYTNRVKKVAIAIPQYSPYPYYSFCWADGWFICCKCLASFIFSSLSAATVYFTILFVQLVRGIYAR